VVNGEVYDGTAYLEEHPGGAQSIVAAAATDATDEFMSIRECYRVTLLRANESADSETAKAMMLGHHIGTLDEAAKKALRASGELNGMAHESRREVFLQPRTWSNAKLHSRENVSWNTRIFTFKLEHDDQSLGLRTGQHLMMRLRDPVTREAIVRCYTPISEIEKKGYVDLLIKVYSASENRKGGIMSMAIDSLPIGHELALKGPIGRFEYHGRGEYSLGSARRIAKKFLMICGGTGVTPIYQVLFSFNSLYINTQDHTPFIRSSEQ
jgi:nitrate reductase (NAD(P)H)